MATEVSSQPISQPIADVDAGAREGVLLRTVRRLAD